MRRYTLTLVLFSILLALSASGQECGDFNGSGGAPDAADLTGLVQFLFQAGTPPADSALADVDGRWGITIADLARFIDMVWQGGPPLVCTIAQDYH